MVPVYNVEAYLERCLQSLVNQTFKDIEILIINDCSPDDSQTIIDHYVKSYNGMVRCIVHKENLGLGGARNTGIDNAYGKYIIFIDSDDYVELDMCEKLRSVAIANDSDVVGCDYLVGKPGSYKERSDFPSQVCGALDYDKRRLLISGLSTSAVAKLIKRDLLVNNNLYFPEHMKNEDLATVPLWWVYVNRFDMVQEPMYYYVQTENSITRTKNSTSYYEIISAALRVYDLFLERELDKEYEECMINVILKGVGTEVNQLVNNVNKPEKDEIIRLRDCAKKHLRDYQNNEFFVTKYEPFVLDAVDLLMKSVDDFIKYLESDAATKSTDYKRVYSFLNLKSMNMLEWLKDKGYKVAIWGAGAKGKSFLQEVDNSHKFVQWVIDKNSDKWNTSLPTGHTIKGFKEIADDVDVILVMNRFHFESIRREVKLFRPNIKLVNMDIYYMASENHKVEEFVD